jgi:membrane fusion protein, multidrug efflux system
MTRTAHYMLAWRAVPLRLRQVNPNKVVALNFFRSRFVWGLGELIFLLMFACGPQAALAQQQQPVPVGTAPAQIQDVPIILSGLGTVQPLNVVQIKAQANGTLIALPVHEGQYVHRGDVLAEIDPRPYKAALDQAQAQRDEDTATLQSAELDLKRFQSLAKSSFAPIQQVDDQQATVNKLIATVALDNAAIETAQINLGYTVISAPFDGRAGFYQLTLGNLVEVANQTPIITITETRPISVVFTLPESDLPRIVQAQSNGAVPVQVFDSTSGKALSMGTLLTPNNMIDTTTGTISLKATFANTDDHLWAGQFVNAQVTIGTLPKVVTVPTLAVNHGPDGTFVYVVAANGTAQQVNVTAGHQWDDRQVVTKGLSGNETVVVSGQSRLTPGTPVKATAVAGNGTPATPLSGPTPSAS